ncbi:hypothetical protein M514_03149, partial [Trichuris suis]
MEQKEATTKNESENQAKRRIQEGLRYLETELEPEVDDLMAEVVLARREIANECLRLWKGTYENRLAKILNQNLGRQTTAATINYQRRVSGLLKTSKFRIDEIDQPVSTPDFSEIANKIEDLKANVINAKRTLEFLETLKADSVETPLRNADE